MAARLWTPEQRLRQGEAIRRWKPWRLSTGPRTAEGKIRSSRNALARNHLATIKSLMTEISSLLKIQRTSTRKLHQ
jgi:hypothetical protein